MIQFAKLSGMGQSVLNDHADGKKHLESVKRVKSFLKKPSSALSSQI